MQSRQKTRNYRVYAQADRRERYCAERDIGRLLSLEQMAEDGVLLAYLTDEQAESAEDIAIRTERMEEMCAALAMMEPEEQHLLEAVVLGGMTERDYAASIGLSQKGVNKRKKRILEKLKKEVLNLGGYREG